MMGAYVPKFPPAHGDPWWAMMRRVHIIEKTRKWYFDLWWRWIPGGVIEVKWPRGWVLIDEQPDGSKTEAESADPNDHYRPWMEQNVGKQGWDWDWRIGSVENDTLLIKFRRAKEEWAAMAALRWA